ncbi:MAG: DUF1631 family protein [Pseudomonadota bacterium]
MAALHYPLSTPHPPKVESVNAAVVPGPSLASHPLQALLRDEVVQAADELIRGFVDELDSAMQALLAESRNATETRAVLDLGQSLSLNRPALVRSFLAALKRRFDPLQRTATAGVFDLERLCLLPAEEMEENIALMHLAQQAEQKAAEDGRQLLARLQWAARDLTLPALAEALNAQALPACFAAALRQAGLNTAERVLAYRLVESHAIQGWPLVVQRALQVLDRQGLRMARPLAANAAEDAAPMISTATTQTLREARASLVSGPDGALAQALLRAIEPPADSQGAGLITALAAGWLDGLLAEPELPPAFAPDLESLRFVVIKAALCDPSFFLHAIHPVRNAVDELVQKAAFIGLQGYSLAKVRAELKETAARISIHGHFALDALSMLPPLDAELAHQFRQQMSKDQDARREGLLHRVRTLAAREVDARTLDVSLPPAARAALARGFLPLLSTLLLRHGAASPSTRQARQLLERFVDSFALCIGGDERRAVLGELCRVLVDAGLGDDYVAGVCVELENAYAELEEEAQSSLPRGDVVGTLNEINDILANIGTLPVLESYRGEAGQPAAPAAGAAHIDTSAYTLTPITASNDIGMAAAQHNPLEILLATGQWFRVRDYKRGDDRWLCLSGVHLAQDRVGFSGFDGATVLAMRASQFVQDLTSGLAEPLNPDAGVQQALQGLRAQSNLVPDRLHSFG